MEAADIQQLNAEIAQKRYLIDQIRQGMAQMVVGQAHLVDALLIGLLADGHILLEGMPGLAKTLAIKTLAQLLDANYKRIQFTPDLLPADVVGTLMYSQKNEEFQVKQGPIFSNFILADEINRAPAKVQSALLEAMQERQVTLGEQTFMLPKPFLVMATQNPIDQEGTYPLPEAQVDRFMLKVRIGYPSHAEEMQIVRDQMKRDRQVIKPILSLQDLSELRALVSRVYLDEKIERYIVDIVIATREPERIDLPQYRSYLTFGASPRASLSLALAARAQAFMQGRGFVVPEDVRAVSLDVLRHRIGLSFEAEANELSSDDIIREIINKTQVP